MIEDGTMLDCGHAKHWKTGYAVLGSLGGETMCTPCNGARKRNSYEPKVLRRERVSLEGRIGTSTSVGLIPWPEDIEQMQRTGSSFPMSHGNCCAILNMYAENASHIIQTMPDVATDCEVEIVSLGGRERVRVVDARIPRGYLHHVCDACGVYES